MKRTKPAKKTASPKAKVAEARKLHAKIYVLLDGAVEDAARKIMAEHPLAQEYVQAMGSWFFVVTLSDVDGATHEVTASAWSDLSRFYSPDYTNTATMNALKKLGEAIEAFSTNVMDAYADLLESRFSAMRFTARGKIIESW